MELKKAEEERVKKKKTVDGTKEKRSGGEKREA